MSYMRNFSLLLFGSLLWWLPIATQIFQPTTIQTITKVTTVTPAACGGSRGFDILFYSDFGSGADTILPFDPGHLLPEYPFVPDGPPDTSSYTVANSTAGWDGVADSWLETGDIDPNFDEGYMLVVNASPTPGGIFLDRIAGVCGNTTYTLNFDILNLYDTLLPPATLPNIDILIDGDILLSTGDIPQNGQWNFFEISFETDTNAGEVLIQFRSNSAGEDGNDFAIDNLFLTPCGPDLLAEEIAPEARCIGDTLQLQLTTSGTPFDSTWIRWQSSLNDGRTWADYGDPTTDPIFDVNGLADGVRFRAVVANTRLGVDTSSCRIISNEVIIQFNDFNSCPGYSFSDIGALCNGSLGENIFPDGEFGSGEENVLLPDPGISPFYQYQPNPPPNDGFYTITNSTTPWGSFADGWLNIEDNSDDPNGYFMVINADSNPGIFYTDTVEVCGNTLYEFSADVFNLHINQPFFQNPNIEFLIDGVSILQSGEVPQDSSWHTYGFTFTTKPDITQLVLSVRNFAPGGADNVGNDFALDNIRIRACGPTVTAFEVAPQPRCPGEPTEIRAGITTGYPNPSILWQVSTDEGENWEDFSGPTTDTILLINAIPADAQFRALVAETPEKIFVPSCRIISNPVVLDYPPVEDCWDTPIDLSGDLCNGRQGANGVPDGDFGRDTTLFAQPLADDLTSYFFRRDSFETDGSYTITNDLNYDPCFGLLQDTCWIPLQDRGGDSLGYFMVINADFEPGIFFRNEVMGLCEDLTYQFSVDIINLNRTFFYPNNPNGTDTITLPNVDFIIGQPGISEELQMGAPAIYNTGDITNDSTWQTFGFTFTMKAGFSDLSLALRNNSPGGGGNDLALDNITISVCGPDATIAPYSLCTVEPVTLEAIIVGDQFGPDPVLQWQQSTDEGQTWTDINGETSRNLFIQSPVPGHQYRYLVADIVGNLSRELCHISSEIDTIFIQTPFGANLEETICQGESFSIGVNDYSTTGEYTEILTASNGCDSIVNLNLTVLDTFFTETNIRLCFGETINGFRPERDTTLQAVFTSRTGCDSTVITRITVSDLVPFSITGDSILCGTDSITLTAPVDGAYFWSNSATTQSTKVGSPGLYSVVVTDELGCNQEAFINVVASNLQPFEISGDSLLCRGDSTILIAPLEGTYLWSTGELTQSITVNSGGTYSVAISDDLGCTVTDEIEVIQSTLVPFQIEGDAVVCVGATTTLTAPVSGNYSWSTGDTTQSITVDAAGTFSVVVTDDLGCSESASVNVVASTLQPFTLEVNSILCLGESLTLTAPVMGNYQWSTGETTQSITINAGGDYSLTITDDLGCEQSATATVQATSLPDPIPIDGDAFLCSTESATLNADASGTYLWSTGETTQSINVDAPGTYSVVVTDNLGCESTGSIEVSQGQLNADIVINPPVCAEDSNGSIIVTNLVGANGGVIYQLNNGIRQESPEFNDLAAGSYTVQVTDQEGCAFEETVLLPEGDQLDISILAPDKPLRSSDSLQLMPLITGDFVSTNWTPAAGLSCTDCPNPVASPNVSTAYSLTVVSPNGCVRTATVNLEVDNSRRVFIPNAFAPEGQEAANRIFTIYGEDEIEFINQMVIFDRWGNKLFEAQNFAPGDESTAWDGTINGQRAQVGVYVYYAEIAFRDGTTEVFYGDVALVR